MRLGQNVPYIDAMNKADIFERAFVTLIAERVEDLGMPHSEFGRRVFGETAGARLWRSCRGSEQRPARKVTLGEAYRMAEALGTDFPSLVWNLSQAAKNRGMLTEDPSET